MLLNNNVLHSSRDKLKIEIALQLKNKLVGGSRACVGDENIVGGESVVQQ